MLTPLPTNKPNPKPGDKIKITAIHGQGLYGPDGSKPLQIGDVLTVLNCAIGEAKQSYITYKSTGQVSTVYTDGIAEKQLDTWWCFLSGIDFEIVGNEVTKCNCDRRTLMVSGCICGYLKKRRNMV